MPTFLSDPPLAGLVTLGLAVLIAAGVWARYRRRVLLGVFVLLLLVFLNWLLIALANESPREEAVRRVNAMAAALETKDWAKFSEHISESFNKNGVRKPDVKRYFDQGAAYDLRAVAWNFALTDPPQVSDTEVVIQFDAKASPPTGEPLMRHFRSTFVKDPDGKFRMKSYLAFDYVQKNQPADVP